jgi:hypothetical protein
LSCKALRLRTFSGKLSIQELLSVYPAEQKEELEKFFKEKDLSRDQMLSLSGENSATT